MLYIIMKRDTVVSFNGRMTFDGEEEEEYQWHVGERLPNIPVEKIREIQADGDELTHVDNLFTFEGMCTIPRPRKKVVRWHGDIARTIYLNL